MSYLFRSRTEKAIRNRYGIYKNVSDRPHHPIRSALDRASSTPKTAPFSRAVECQGPSKSHLFQELENTLISRWQRVSILSPQMSSLMSDRSTKPQIIAKNRIFFEIFSLLSDYPSWHMSVLSIRRSLKDPWRVHKQGAYYKKVLEHFKPYKNHPLIADPVFDNNKSRFEYTILTLPPRLAHKIHNPQPLDLTIVIPYRGGDGQIYCNNRYFWPI